MFELLAHQSLGVLAAYPEPPSDAEPDRSPWLYPSRAVDRDADLLPDVMEADTADDPPWREYAGRLIMIEEPRALQIHRKNDHRHLPARKPWEQWRHLRSRLR